MIKVKLLIMENSFNRYGGSIAFKPAIALVNSEDISFGAALSQITLTLQFICSRPFEEQKVNRSMRASYDKFLNYTAKPKRVFKRKKTELEIQTRVSFVSSEDFFPNSKPEYKIRNETYFRDWNIEVLNILREELILSKERFKKTDDFRFDDCVAWLSTLPQKLPSTKEEVDLLINAYDQRRKAECENLSEWDRLGIEWPDYHKNARIIVSDSVLWSHTDEFAPNGNDTGADVLHDFQSNKSKILTSEDHGREIFTQEWESLWGEQIPEPTGDYEDLALNDYRKFVVGYAFSYLKCLGFCPEWLKVDALKHLREYEVFIEREYSNWPHKREFKTMNEIVKSCLERSKP